MMTLKKLGAEPEAGKLFLGLTLLMAGGLANAYQSGRAPAEVSGTITVTNTDIVCTQEVKECRDGSFVGRDPQAGCSFRPCPAPRVNPSS